MPLYRCTNCDHPVYFENPRCLRCDAELGFDPELLTLIAFEPGPDFWRALPADGQPVPPPMTGSERVSGWPTPARPLAPCDNRNGAAACNWMRPAGDGGLCRACRMTTVLPDQSVAANREAWMQAEQAKRRWLMTILRLGLPAEARDDAHPHGLQVRIVRRIEGQEEAITGHADGVITIDAAECDPVERAAQRSALDEPYRTVLGHFRHESGHYYWQTLVGEHPARLASFRELFGDERRDYGDALRAHYHDGAPTDWRESHVSAYGASHPWEDFAETWAHYLHLIDLVSAADAWGLALRNYPAAEARDFAQAAQTGDPEFEALLERWLPVSLYANSVSRSLGHEDAYPFAPTPAVLAKMGWVHRLIRDAAAEHPAGGASHARAFAAAAP